MTEFTKFNEMKTLQACKSIASTICHHYLSTYKPYWKTQSLSDLDYMNAQYDGFLNWLWIVAKKHQLDPGLLYSGFFYFASFTLFQVEDSDPDLFLKQKMQKDFRERIPITYSMWSLMKFQMWELSELRKLFGVCLWIASKYQTDCHERYVASYWSTCTGIQPSMLTILETHIIKILKFQFFITQDNFETIKKLCIQTESRFAIEKYKLEKKKVRNSARRSLFKYYPTKALSRMDTVPDSPILQ